MSLYAVNLLGINITNSPKKEILEEIQKYLILPTTHYPLQTKKSAKPLTIVTPNPEQVVFANQNLYFQELLNRADVAIPDGVGIVWASRILTKNPTSDIQHPISNAIPGIDFMENLVEIAANQRVPIALIGGEEKVAVKAFECLRQKYPGLSGVAMDAPEFVIEDSKLLLRATKKGINNEILNTEQASKNFQYTFVQNDSQKMLSSIVQYDDVDEYFQKVIGVLKENSIGMVFVALGVPKQEYFIDTLKSLILNLKSPVCMMSVGGSLDVISGRIQRAPKSIRMLGFEWFWRLVQEPWRIKRQFALSQFIWLVVLKRFGLK